MRKWEAGRGGHKPGDGGPQYRYVMGPFFEADGLLPVFHLQSRIRLPHGYTLFSIGGGRRADGLVYCRAHLSLKAVAGSLEMSRVLRLARRATEKNS